MKNYLTITIAGLFILMITISLASAGEYNQKVHQAQEKLQKLGYQPGATDGIMGKNTRKAVKKFQKDRGLQATGKLDHMTLDTILNLAAEASRASGTAGESVRQALSAAQQILKALGFAPGPADGIMGDKTRTAIRKFQKEHGLSVTGTLNDKTFQEIKQASGKMGKDRQEQENQKTNSTKRAGFQGEKSQKSDHREFSENQDMREQERSSRRHP